MEDLIAKGPISKYAHGVPSVTGGPIPEMLKNYMDVSMGVVLLGLGLGGPQTLISTADGFYERFCISGQQTLCSATQGFAGFSCSMGGGASAQPCPSLLGAPPTTPAQLSTPTCVPLWGRGGQVGVPVAPP